MSREKQIEEIARVMCGGCPDGHECLHSLCADWYRAEALYNAGYRKQSEGEWMSYISPVCLSGDLYYKCSICGTNDPYQHTTKRAKFCPNCGAKMKGGAE